MIQKYFVVDVDGTLTDGGIYYDENGNESKKFCAKDGVGFYALHQAGAKIMVLTGRECKATTRRMNELKVDYLVQNIKDKAEYLERFLIEKSIDKKEVVYIGDDLNDLSSMKLCGFIGCPADACREVKEIADYVSDIKGGYGAVRDIIEFLLRKSGEWDMTVSKVYGIR